MVGAGHEGEEGRGDRGEEGGEDRVAEVDREDLVAGDGKADLEDHAATEDIGPEDHEGKEEGTARVADGDRVAREEVVGTEIGRDHV